MHRFAGLRGFSALSLLVFLFGLPLSAQQFTADFASRTSSSAKPIPPGIIASQLGFLTGLGSLNQLKQDGYAELRTNAQLPNIFLTSSVPDWTQIDPTINLLKSAGIKTLIVMTFTPGWLQPNPNPCPSSTQPYHAPPTDVNQWAQLTASFVAHMDQTFPGWVTDYEIWNEPDVQNGLCAADNSDATRLSTYMTLYAAAAPAMRAQALADHAQIRIGGPVSGGGGLNWITTLLGSASTANYVDFVSYHKYMGYITLLQQGMTWDGAGGTPSLLALEQSANGGFAQSFKAVSSVVRGGLQPNAASTPILITEYNDDAAFLTPSLSDCCRNSPVYSPLFNSIAVADFLNTVYAGAQNVPAKLIYFSASTSAGQFCLLGVIDPLMDCSTVGGALQPYPQLYAYQLLAAPNFLNLNAGGSMAVSVSVPSPLIGTAFYTNSGNALLVVNPTANDFAGLTISIQRPGDVSSHANLYLLSSTNPTITTETVNFSAASGNQLSTSLTVPAFTVVAFALPVITSGRVNVTMGPTSATLQVGHSQAFTATVTGTGNTAVTWSVDGIPGGNTGKGTISSSGMYSASATPGSHIVTATSVADPTKSASAAVIVTAAPDFSLSSSVSAATISAGETVKFTVALTPSPGFSGTVSLNCAGVPPQSTCAAAPNSVVLSGTSKTATVSITTTARTSAASLMPFRGILGLLGAAAMFGLFLVCAPIRISGQSRRVLLIAVLGILVSGFWTSCGGGSSSPPPPPITGTPAGTYTLTITGSSGSAAHTANFNLKVN
jgi:hypothetical protein